jgi:hypothetical protein
VQWDVGGFRNFGGDDGSISPCLAIEAGRRMKKEVQKGARAN